MESKRNANSPGASCDGVSLCLCLAMIATLPLLHFVLYYTAKVLTISYQQTYILWITVQTVITKFEYRKQ